MTPSGYGCITLVRPPATPCRYDVYQTEERLHRMWGEEHIFTLPPGTFPGRVYGRRPNYDDPVR
jgi:hypothetical protein